MLLDWFTNYGAYQTLFHCMADDIFWINTLCLLSLFVTIGYTFIAHHAWCKYRQAKKKSPMANLLMSFIVIFVLCAVCGYGFNILRLFWPGYRLLAILLFFLTGVTWWFLWKCKKQKFFEILFSLEVPNGKQE